MCNIAKLRGMTLYYPKAKAAYTTAAVSVTVLVCEWFIEKCRAHHTARNLFCSSNSVSGHASMFPSNMHTVIDVPEDNVAIAVHNKVRPLDCRHHIRDNESSDMRVIALAHWGYDKQVKNCVLKECTRVVHFTSRRWWVMNGKQWHQKKNLLWLIISKQCMNSMIWYTM